MIDEGTIDSSASRVTFPTLLSEIKSLPERDVRDHILLSNVWCENAFDIAVKLHKVEIAEVLIPLMKISERTNHIQLMGVQLSAALTSDPIDKQIVEHIMPFFNLLISYYPFTTVNPLSLVSSVVRKFYIEYEFS
jgi:hypothetical protein